MKKIIIYSLILLALLSRYGFNLSYNVIAETNVVDVPDKIDVKEEETSFDVKLNKQLSNNQRVRIVLTGNDYLSCDNDLKIKVETSLSNVILTNSSPTSTITIRHEELPFGNWKSNINLSFILEETKTAQIIKPQIIEPPKEEIKEEVKETPVVLPVIKKEYKTMYAYKTVTAWDEENFLLEKPSTDCEERTQYAYQEANFSQATYSLSKPEDGIYKEDTQYGYNQRSKQAVDVPKTGFRRITYNNVGKCPYDCISGTQNDYGSGCECQINEAYTYYETSYAYSGWSLNNSSWRFNSPYGSSDTVSPTTRVVYLTPESFNEASDWSYEEKQSTSTAKAISRTVYVTPAAYSDISEYQDSKPEGEHIEIIEQEFYRLITDGVAGEWIKNE